MKPRALITGATGFLGGALARRLHAEGWEVTGVGRNQAAGVHLTNSGVKFLPLDLADRRATKEACGGQEYIFHCAALSAPWGRRREFITANVSATSSVVAACEHHGVQRLVHVSTPSIYFEERDRFDLTESSPPAARPVNDYAQTKLQGEIIVQAAARIETVILRPRAIFGPGDTTLFPRLLRVAGSRGFPLIGMGDPLVEVTYIDNVVDALISASQAPAAAGKTYNLTNGEAWPREKLLAEIFQAAGQPWKPRRVSIRKARWAAMALEAGSRLLTAGHWEPPLTRYSAGVLAYSQTFDLKAAKCDLAYSPRVSVGDGIERFAKWWRETHP